MELNKLIRDVPDFPQPGILFRDITPLLNDPAGLRYVTDELYERYRDAGLTKIVGVESRGFIFGAPLAVALGVGFVPARKPGKLPYKTIEESYSLEYGTNTIQMHKDAVHAGDTVLVIDDLLATGGTMMATCSLVEQLGGTILECAVVIELTFLEGREKLAGRPFYTMLQY